jgi:hypothetical protein
MAAVCLQERARIPPLDRGGSNREAGLGGAMIPLSAAFGLPAAFGDRPPRKGG